MDVESWRRSVAIWWFYAILNTFGSSHLFSIFQFLLIHFLNQSIKILVEIYFLIDWVLRIFYQRIQLRNRFDLITATCFRLNLFITSKFSKFLNFISLKFLCISQLTDQSVLFCFFTADFVLDILGVILIKRLIFNLSKRICYTWFAYILVLIGGLYVFVFS